MGVRKGAGTCEAQDRSSSLWSSMGAGSCRAEDEGGSLWSSGCKQEFMGIDESRNLWVLGRESELVELTMGAEACRGQDGSRSKDRTKYPKPHDKSRTL